MKNWRKKSIFGLILLRIVLVALVFVAILGSIIYKQIDSTLIILRNRSLISTAQDIASYLERTPEGAIYLDMPAVDRNFYANAGRFHQYVVRGPDHQILFTSPIAFSDRYPLEIQNEEPVFDFYGPRGTHYLGTSLIYDFGGKPYLIPVAQSEKTAEAFSDMLTSNFINRTAIISAPFVFALILIIYFSLKQSLKPLLDVSRQAEQISFQKSEIRLNEENLPLEIQPLVIAINSALHRLGEGIKSQQEFTANVAHELRTPLAILKTRVETLQDKKSAWLLEQDIDGIIHTVNQMLDLSRLDFSETISMESLVLSDIVKSVCKDMWPLFIKQKRELIIFGSEEKARVLGNEDIIYRAMRNLLDNAMLYSPADKPVEVHIKGNTVSVWDHGKTIPVEDREKIFKRFHRSDRQKSKIGTGLGLSIVDKAMQIQNGTVVLDTLTEGEGNIFRLEFPVIVKDAETQKI